jgi:sugar (pentulose or hexulose) kinase
MLLGIDIGTTNSKAGLFGKDGKPIAIASRPTATHQNERGEFYYEPEEMWKLLASAVREVIRGVDPKEIEAVGITSMAESGLLVDMDTGKPLSPFMPWFDTCSKPQSDFIKSQCDTFERFQASGLHLSFKLGLCKLLWIREHYPEAFTPKARWLSASGYIAYRLSGAMGFDYSLAARTYAFRVDTKTWDEPWLRQFGIDPAIYPQALPSGTTLGGVTPAAAAATGLAEGMPVAIAGHDHVVAALAVGAITKGVIYDSMGTAETLVGTMEEKALDRKEYESGLSFGCHVAEGRYFWMGGNSSSGGSVEWLRSQLSEEQMSYERLLGLLDRTKPGPTGILYFPYLTGSGAPAPDTKAKAAFIGLTKEHGQGDIIKAVLEGTAYQLESIRRSAEEIAGSPIERLQVVGGGTRNKHWLQVKADVSDFTLELPPIPEATLLGAAMAAGIGAGSYASAEEAAKAIDKSGAGLVAGSPERHEAYKKLYETGYSALQGPLRSYYKEM